MVSEYYDSRFDYHVATKDHFKSSRLFRLALGMEKATPQEIEHLTICKKCRKYFDSYLENKTEKI